MTRLPTREYNMDDRESETVSRDEDEEEDNIQHHDLLTEFRIALNNMSFNATMNLVFLGVLVFFIFFSKWLRYSIFLTSTLESKVTNLFQTNLTILYLGHQFQLLWSIYKLHSNTSYYSIKSLDFGLCYPWLSWTKCRKPNKCLEKWYLYLIQLAGHLFHHCKVDSVLTSFVIIVHSIESTGHSLGPTQCTLGLVHCPEQTQSA